MAEFTLQERVAPLVEMVGTLSPEPGEISFRDSPILKRIIEELQNITEEHDDLFFAYVSYVFVAETYQRMGRFSLAADNRLCALQTALKLKKLYAEEIEDIGYTIVYFIRNRNYYVDDGCSEFKDMIVELVGEEEAEARYKEALSRRRSLKSDPVEMTPEYLAVIDEVEEKIAAKQVHFGMGACYEIWSLKREFLEEKGIHWKSPAIMNPRVLFD